MIKTHRIIAKRCPFPQSLTGFGRNRVAFTHSIQHRNNDFMSRAIELAKYAESIGEVPIGAVLVFENQIIGEGWNQPIASCDATAHAEIIALREGCKKMKNYRLPNTLLYVTLEPCMMCVGAMIHARIEHCIFGAFDPKSGAAGSVNNIFEAKGINHHVKVTGGILADECGALLKKFFKTKRF